MQTQDLVIHATNVIGLGASHVVLELLQAIDRTYVGHQVTAYLPVSGVLSRLTVKSMHCCHVNRRLPNAISRLVETTLSDRALVPSRRTLVLGDVPLPQRSGQTVLVHQAHLIKPHVSPMSSRSLKFSAMRALFRRNLRNVDRLIVQTDVMAREMLQSYPELEGRLCVVPHPAPDWLNGHQWNRTRQRGESLHLFYPAAFYPHKNHSLLVALGPLLGKLGARVKITATIDPSHVASPTPTPWLHLVGQLPPAKVAEFYTEADALIFPSFHESFGLPLLEAMMVGLPILCADLPYARWMCEDEAIYFTPTSPSSMAQGIRTLRERLTSDWHPDYSRPLRKFPTSWDSVAEAMLK